MVRVRGIEPRFQAWEAHVIAVILHPLTTFDEKTRTLQGTRTRSNINQISALFSFARLTRLPIHDRGSNQDLNSNDDNLSGWGPPLSLSGQYLSRV